MAPGILQKQIQPIADPIINPINPPIVGFIAVSFPAGYGSSWFTWLAHCAIDMRMFGVSLGATLELPIVCLLFPELP